MTKPRKVSSLIGRVIASDPSVKAFDFNGDTCVLFVRLTSRLAWVQLLEDVELPVLDRFEILVMDNNGKREKRFCIKWDCSGIKLPEETISTGFCFSDRGDEKKARRGVMAQEDEGARIIDGRRHVGSGAIQDLKSDASSDVWQQEAKQTKAKSFRLTLDVLDKITREARVQGKQPMVFLRFTDSPEQIVAEDDWVIMPKSAFEGMK